MEERGSLGMLMMILRLALIGALIVIGIVNILLVTQLLSGIKMIAEGSDTNIISSMWLFLDLISP